MPGMGELIIILLIVLVVFGANKLPGIGDALGRSIKNFKKASNVAEEEDSDAKADAKADATDKSGKRALAGSVLGSPDGQRAAFGEDDLKLLFEPLR